MKVEFTAKHLSLPMKILYITLENISLHKGSVVHIKEVLYGIKKKGYQVGLMGRSWGKIDGVEDFYNLQIKKIINYNSLSIIVSSILLFFFLFKVLPKYDLIYARDYHTTILALIPRIIFQKRLIVEINGLASEEQRIKSYSVLNRVVSFIISYTEKIALRNSDRIIAVTPQIASYLTHHYKCPSEKIRIVSNGVNIEQFQPIQDKRLLTRLKEELKVPQEDILITFVGNLAPWQGIEYLIEVAPLLLQGYKNVRFLIVGDGVLKNKLISKVKTLGILEYFIFTGMVNYEKIPIYINISDICVLPKIKLKSGYSPLKLYEYMACGKPIVASRVEGIDFIEKEGVGLLMEVEDLKSFKETLVELLEDDKKRKAMGQKGVNLAHKKFNWNSKINEIEEVFKELV